MKKTKNKFEERTKQFLKKKKVKFEYETKKIEYTLKGWYWPDFPVITRSGNEFLLECKGYFRPEHKRKMLAVKKQHPELDIRILFYSYNKQYVRWAERNGFRYAIGTIPDEWLEN